MPQDKKRQREAPSEKPQPGKGKARLSKSNPDYALRSLAVADLTTKGQPQQAISKRLGISQPQVSRLLEHAREMGWIETTPRLDESRIEPHLLERMRQEYLEHKGVAQAVRRWIPEGVRCEVRVAEGVEDVFCGIAAKWIAEMLQASELIGVMFGRTVNKIVEGIGEHRKGAPPAPHVRVIPTCPEPHYLLNRKRSARYSSTLLADDLHRHLTGKAPWEGTSPDEDTPSLQGVPAYVGSGLTAAERRAIRKYIDGLPGHKLIFGETVEKAAGKAAGKSAGKGNGKAGKAGKPPLLGKLDTILTSVGIVDPDSSRRGIFLEERLAQEPDLTPEQLNRWVFGDISGILLRRPGIDPQGRERVNELNAGWLGATFEHYRACVRRATESGRPGVILVAAGGEKAEMVCAAVQCGLANTLIINHELADSLQALPTLGVLPKPRTRA
jgi:DNA-binding transcriptional regulator LsrR (DeoR family)